MVLSEKLFNTIILVVIFLFISSIILAALQRYIAAIFAILSGLILVSFISEIRSERK